MRNSAIWLSRQTRAGAQGTGATFTTFDSCGSSLMARRAQWRRQGSGVCDSASSRVTRRERANASRPHALVCKGPRESSGRGNVSRETRQAASVAVDTVAHAAVLALLACAVPTARCSTTRETLGNARSRVLRVASCRTADLRRLLSRKIHLRAHARRASAMRYVSRETR